MASMVDTCASLAEATFRPDDCSVSSLPDVEFFDAQSDDASMSTSATDLGVEEEIVDLAAEMVPTFFESGTLMWEIAAHTEKVHMGAEPRMSGPEIVFTDSSFLSRRTQNSRQASEDEDGNDDEGPKSGMLSGQHCFELLTDEDVPLCSETSSEIEEPLKAGTSGTHAVPRLNLNRDAQPESELGNTPTRAAASYLFDALKCPDRVVIDDCEWMEEQYRNRGNALRVFDSQRVKPPRALTMGRVTSLKTASAKDTKNLPLADSASDMTTNGPKYVIGDILMLREQQRRLKHAQLFRNASMQQPRQHIPAAKRVTESTLKQWGTSPVTSPRPRHSGCSLKDALCTAMSKINDVLYNCTHAKQRRQERRLLKKLHANSQGSMNVSSSACGAYRRRHHLMCQKMEGMINNEDKTRSTRKVSKSRHSVIPGTRKSAGAFPGLDLKKIKG